ncbi:MAG: hypothetical protein KC476_08800 [Cyanobacteria bacterium HKST-UBA06]|nr:hypothetical protein [Cyanobacteria bacterium HKST-UBA06]
MLLAALRFPTKTGFAYSLGLLLAALFLLGCPGWALANNVYIAAGHQHLEPLNGMTTLDGGVVIKTDTATMSAGSAQMVLSGSAPQSLVMNGGASMTRLENNVEQTIHANQVAVDFATNDVNAQGSVSTQMADKGKPADNVTIQSDDQVFDQTNHVMRAIGHVKVTKGDMVATSPEAVITMGDDGQAKKALFKNGAKLVSSDQILTAELITIDLATGDIYAEKNTRSQIKSKPDDAKQTGKKPQPAPAAKAGDTKDDVEVTADFQELNQDTGTLIANGNAVVNYGDFIAKGPKATFYSENNTLDHITLTNRAEIVDNDRRVIGDTVIITIDPRQFTAKGNVQSFMQTKQKAEPEKKPDARPEPDASQPAAKTKPVSAKPAAAKTGSNKTSGSKTSAHQSAQAVSATVQSAKATKQAPPKPAINQAALNEALMLEEASR